MRPQKHPKQGAAEIPAAYRSGLPSSVGPSRGCWPYVSEAASPRRAEPDRTDPPRLSVPDRQQLTLAHDHR